MKYNNYLIAGGAGFIGSHISDMLVKKGHNVSVIDNLSTGKKDNIKHLLDHENFSFFDFDITEPMDIQMSPDIIIHLAAIANPSDYEKNPLCSLSVNSDGNRNLLNYAEKHSSKFLFFSSSEIYGNHNPHPDDGLKENEISKTLLGHKRSPYFVGKMFGEEFVRNFSESSGIEYLIVRPFNIYGPKMDRNSGYGRVIPNFIRRGLKQKPLLINGDGTQERSFCHVSDLIRCLYEIFEEKEWPYKVVNIGNPDPISIKQLAIRINEIVNNPAGYEFTERFDHEPDYREPNINRIKEWVGWLPEISLKTGLKKTIQEDNVFRGISDGT